MINIKDTINDSVEVKQLMLNDCLKEIELAVDIMIESAKKGNKILWCGNGGSAADAQHMAAELMGIRIPSNDTQRIQECHLLVEHIFCESVEASILN